jgi:hypothetical protein
MLVLVSVNNPPAEVSQDDVKNHIVKTLKYSNNEMGETFGRVEVSIPNEATLRFLLMTSINGTYGKYGGPKKEG